MTTGDDPDRPRKYRVLFSVSNAAERPNRKAPYTGTAEIRGPELAAKGMSMAIPRVATILGVVVVGACISISAVSGGGQGGSGRSPFYWGFIGAAVGAGAALAGWALAKLLQVTIAAPLLPAATTVHGSGREAFIQLRRPNGRYLYLMPTPKAEADFRDLAALLKDPTMAIRRSDPRK